MVTLACTCGGGSVACTCVLAAPLQRSSRACSTWPRTTTCASPVTRHPSPVTRHPSHRTNLATPNAIALGASASCCLPHFTLFSRCTKQRVTHATHARPLADLRQAAAVLQQRLQPLPANAQRSRPQIWREPDGPPDTLLLCHFGPVLHKQLLLPQRQQQRRLCDDGHMSLIGHMSHYHLTCGAAAAQLHVPTAARASFNANIRL